MSQASVKVDAPVISKAIPNEGYAGDEINLNGDNMSGVRTATWECEGQTKNVPAKPSSNTLVVAKVPEGMPQGNGTVLVTSPGGNSNKVPFVFKR